MLLMKGIAAILFGALHAGPVNGLLPMHTNYEERRRNQQSNREAIVHQYGVTDDDLTQIRKRLLVHDRSDFEAPVSPKARS